MILLGIFGGVARFDGARFVGFDVLRGGVGEQYGIPVFRMSRIDLGATQM